MRRSEESGATSPCTSRWGMDAGGNEGSAVIPKQGFDEDAQHKAWKGQGTAQNLQEYCRGRGEKVQFPLLSAKVIESHLSQHFCPFTILKTWPGDTKSNGGLATQSWEVSALLDCKAKAGHTRRGDCRHQCSETVPSCHLKSHTMCWTVQCLFTPLVLAGWYLTRHCHLSCDFGRGHEGNPLISCSKQHQSRWGQTPLSWEMHPSLLRQVMQAQPTQAVSKGASAHRWALQASVNEIQKRLVWVRNRRNLGRLRD